MAICSKKRVRMAINHKPVDRVPTAMSCVSVTWEKLMAHYNLASPQEVLDYFDIDIRPVGVAYTGPELETYTNSTGEKITEHWLGYKTKQVWNGIEYNSETVFYPLDEMETLKDLADYQWPNPDFFDYEAIKEKCELNQGRAIQIGWPGVYQVATFLRSPEKLYMDMAANPDFAQKIFDKLNEFELEYYERMFEAAEGEIDILRVCDDYGTQNSLLFSVDMWKKFFTDNTKKLVKLAHKYDAFYLQHSCGAVRAIIPELIKCGVDVLEPLQKVEGMEPEGLKKDFGDKIAFQGGIDTQNLLPFGKKEEVKKEAEHYINVLNKNGGYILSSSQSLEGDIPVENIAALYSARRL